MIFIIVFIIAIAAFCLSAICGGGASFILLPALGLALPGAEIPAALSIGTAVSSVSRMVAFAKHIRWDIVKYFVPLALPGVWLGARVLSVINPVWLEFVIGLFLIINIPYIFKKNDSPKKYHKRWQLPLIGFATGFLSGLTGAVGLLFNHFYLTYGLTKEQIVATRAANELLLHVIKIILYSFLGLFSIQSVIAGSLIALAAVIATWATARLLHKFTERAFRKIGFTAMALSGFIMLSNSAWALYHAEGVRFNMIDSDKSLETKLQWRKRSFIIEFEYDKGFEYERSVELSELPLPLQQKINNMANGARILLIEEVFSGKQHFHELYLERNGREEKHEF